VGPTVDVDVDVAVIGGGMAGVSIASELAATHAVIVLEQESQLAHHATGRSAAAFLESYGGPEVRALTRASRPLLEAAAVDPPLLTPRPLLWIAGPGGQPAIAEMRQQQPGLRPLSPAEAQRMCSVLRTDWATAAVLEPEAQDIDVAALHQAYVRDARSNGVAVSRGSRVSEVTYDGRTWRLRHGRGTVAARVVVNAAGAWADRVATRFGARPCGLQPLRRTVVIARTGQPVPASWPLVAAVDDTFYFRPDGPHVLVSPADETPSEPCDARPDEVDVARAIERLNLATTLGIRSVVTAWAGLRTFAVDRVPVMGFDPDVPGLFWLAGQGGYGIQTAPALARLAAGVLRGDDSPESVAPGLDPVALSPARFRASTTQEPPEDASGSRH
jgi:D-arginine dehydrogenase